MVQEIRQELDKLNELLAAQRVTPYRLGLADPRVMVAAPINAHFMNKRMYDQLVANIQKDGNLGSLPFCWHERQVDPETGEEGTVINILSGHHRVQAAADAGVETVLYLYTDADLTAAERTAIQLAHNAINGEDDLGILRMQWQSLDDIQTKLYSGLDDEFFKSFDPVVLGAFNEKDITFKTIELLFLPNEIERIKSVLTKATGSARLRLVALDEQYDDFADALMRFKEAAQIFNSSTAFMVMIEATNLYCNFLEQMTREATLEDMAIIHDALSENGLVNSEHNASKQKRTT